MLLFADGFEDGSAGWALNANIALSTGRFGNGLLSTGSTGTATLGIVPTAGPIIVGFAVQRPSVACDLVSVSNLDQAARHVKLSAGADGTITVYRGLTGTGTILGSTVANVVPSGAWSYVEVRVTIHDTTGSVVVRANGVQVLNLTNIDTKDGSSTVASSIELGYHNTISGTGQRFDDVYLVDTTGTVNNTFLGEMTVEHLRPNGDDTAQWVGSDLDSVNNYQLVDEAGAFDPADYVAASTVGQRDLYTVAPSARPISSPVLGVIATAVASKTDAGTRTVRLEVKEGAGGAVRQSAELGLPTTFGELRAVFERKGDGSQFTVADVNALRVGMEVMT
jgi:hypothetical protein